MKKYLLAAALVMASTSAMADRMVTGTGNSFENRVDACRKAKDNASRQGSGSEQVASYSACSCEQTINNDKQYYSCNVDAKLEKRNTQ